MPDPEPIKVPAGKVLRVEITPLDTPNALPGRMCGLCGAEATPQAMTDLMASFMRAYGGDGAAIDVFNPAAPSQDQLVALELELRQAATSTADMFLLGLNARPAIEVGPGQLAPFGPPPPPAFPPQSGNAFWPGSILGGAGIYQLQSFPITRFNGIGLPASSRIRFADPGRWFGNAMESRLFTISVDNTKKFFSWDAHAPVGNKVHDFFHVNQKGMYSVFGEADHAAISSTMLVQAKQLRYLKIGGRVFLIVGIVVDTVQLGAAGYESYQTGSPKPIAKAAVRVATGWGAAWAGAKIGMLAGGAAGVETGPGLVLTAIGGGIIGAVGGYFGGNFIADWLFD